jgi:hypothetical protein
LPLKNSVDYEKMEVGETTLLLTTTRLGLYPSTCLGLPCQPLPRDYLGQIGHPLLDFHHQEETYLTLGYGLLHVPDMCLGGIALVIRQEV